MNDIRQERPTKGPILNFLKKYYRQSLYKTFGTLVQKFMVFKTLKLKVS